MAKYVSEIINPELFALAPDAKVAVARARILELGITSAPILNEMRRPVGIVSLRDLIGAGDADTVSQHMAGPVVAIDETATVEDAAHQLAEKGMHRLVVVDDDGCAKGVVALLDVMRAMLSLPMRYSSKFPHEDEIGLTWTDEEPLDPEHIAHAPRSPGIIIISFGAMGVVDRDLLIDSSHSIRDRLVRIYKAPMSESEDLANWMEKEGDNLRYRVSIVLDKKTREHAVRLLRESNMSLPT